MRITSTQNERIKQYAKLQLKKERDATGCFLVEEEHLLQEAFQQGCLETLLVLEGVTPCRDAKEIIEVTEPVLKKLSSQVSLPHQIGVCHKPSFEKKDYQRIVVLDGIQDPGNLGTILRTAVSLGWDEVVCSKDCCDLFNEKTIRSTQGALFHLPVFYEDLPSYLTQVQAKGFPILGTTLKDAQPLPTQPMSPVVLVLGNEGKGISEEVLACCTQRITIPMNQFDSLNVAVAAGICMWALGGKHD